jgi:hypothetical protein
MKIPPLFKKIDSRVIQFLVMVAIVGLFIYLLYHHYHLFVRYQESKTTAGRPPAERSPLLVPAFFNFSPDRSEESGILAQLFSFEKKKPEILPLAMNMNGENTGSGDYRILGVVKKERLFLLVRFNSDNKLRLVGEGGDIDTQSRVKRLYTDHVIITDPSGQEHTYKIFPEQYRYTATGQGPVNPKQNRYSPGRPKADEEERIDRYQGERQPMPPDRDITPGAKKKKNRKNSQRKNDGS